MNSAPATSAGRSPRVAAALLDAVRRPLSGMSMNPARSLASAVPAGTWEALWVYFTAPPIGMLLAAQLYLDARGRSAVRCAKLHHRNAKRCIFCAFHVTGDGTSRPSS